MNIQDAEEAIDVVPESRTESIPKWVEFQKVTFTNWINEVLKSRLKSEEKIFDKTEDNTYSVNDIQTDFRNGLTLIALLETISNKKVQKVKHSHRSPTNQYIRCAKIWTFACSL